MDATPEFVDTRPAYRRALGRSYWFVINQVRRAAARVKQSQRRLYYKARNSRSGRKVLKAADFAAAPRDTYYRRRMAAAYNQTLPNRVVSAADGYGLLAAGSLRGFEAIQPTCMKLFERKTQKMEAITSEEDAYAALRKKRTFLRNLLSNEDLTRNPELVDFALSDDMVSLVTNYLGTVPHLNRVDLLYSVPRESDDAVASQLFHLDPEGLAQAKLFLNIFDVGPAEGPFTFVPAAESARIVGAIRARRKRAGDKDQGRYFDHELAAVGGLQSAISVVGPAGSAAIVDTSRCLHCGSRVQKGTFRLCLYIQYCTSREHGNVFDWKRYRNDAMRRLLLDNSKRLGKENVTAPHQMDN